MGIPQQDASKAKDTKQQAHDKLADAEEDLSERWNNQKMQQAVDTLLGTSAKTFLKVAIAILKSQLRAMSLSTSLEAALRITDQPRHKTP